MTDENTTASDQLRAAGLRVKPLLWDEEEWGRHVGSPPKKMGGFCMWVVRTRGGWKVAGRAGEYATPEDAKAAAQADYERRIRAALEEAMTDYPEDVMRAAREAVAKLSGECDDAKDAQIIADAIMAERERCARIAENMHVVFDDIRRFLRSSTPPELHDKEALFGRITAFHIKPLGRK